MTAKILNNVKHKDLKIGVQLSRALSEFENRAMICTTEYSDLH